METIVVGFDGSEHGLRALERAAQLARGGATIRVVSAVDVTRFSRSGGTSAVDPAEADERTKALEEARTYLASQGVQADFVEGTGDPADVLCLDAEETGADLIVVGTRGLSSAKRWLVGSVSTKVVQHAPCDVLVVR
jgi:nucleotide-binding universal stress UspA family protein